MGSKLLNINIQERDESKLSEGLKVSLAELLNRPQTEEKLEPYRLSDYKEAREEIVPLEASNFFEGRTKDSA